MDPVTIGVIARAAPAALRALRALLPGKAGEVAGKLATVADAVKPLAPSDREAAIKQAIETMPPEERRELLSVTVKLRELEGEARRAELEAETERHREAQTTIRTETESGTEYARNSRPYIARQAYQAGGAYALACECVSRVASFHGASVPGADPAVLAALLAPVVWYMTMRTVDSFSATGRTR